MESAAKWMCTAFCLAVLTALASGCAVARAQEITVWSYQCVDSVCEKVLLAEGADPVALDVCKAMCDPHAMLWPLPSGSVSFSKELVTLDADRVSVLAPTVGGAAKELLDKASARFVGLVRAAAQRARVPADKGGSLLRVEVVIADEEVKRVEINTDETYVLTVSRPMEGQLHALVSAATFFGARHALETLSQLVIADVVHGELRTFSSASIADAPAFTHRGVNLDTARNFFSVASIKRTIEGMAMNKMNTLHWHITDSQSWPFFSDSYPKLSLYGAYSQHQVYHPSDVREVVEYGRVRGVRVLPELDAPAHVGEGWQWTEPGTVVCSKAQPWTSYCVEPPCGQLNPGAEQVYDILAGVYGDMMRLFDSDVFHMGGDEVNIDCWNSSAPVLAAMTQLGFPTTKEGFIRLWDVFQTKAYNKLVEANGGKKLPVILWTSGLTEKDYVDKYLDKDTYIIQIWTKGNDPIIGELIKKEFRLIFSNYDALYLDCGFAGWVTDGNNWCSPYIGWQTIYMNNPHALLIAQGVDSPAARDLVLGAEATLWTEQADESTLDGKLWPRVAALAERLWSNPSTDWRAAEGRMLYQRGRMQESGFHANRLQPEWCLQNEGYCPLTSDKGT